VSETPNASRRDSDLTALSKLLRRLGKNSSQLAFGSAASAALGVLTIALAARSLELAEYGSLILAQQFVYAVDRLVNFQPWQALIKYGTDALASDDRSLFGRLLGFGAVLDFATSALATVLAVGAVLIAAPVAGWGAETVGLVGIYSFVILFNMTGTATAVLRLFDRFDLLAIQQVLAAGCKLIGTLFVYYTGGGLLRFAFVWAIGEAAGYSYLIGQGWRCAGRHGHKVRRSSLRLGGADHPGIWSFLWSTSIYGSIKMSVRTIDALIVGAVLGAASAGLYHIARQVARTAGIVSGPITQAIYPDLAQTWKEGNRALLGQVVYRMCAAGAALGLMIWAVVLIFGRRILALAAGSDFVEAHPVLVWYLLGTAVTLASLAVQPALLALGRPQAPLRAVIVGAVLYFAAIVPLLRIWGLIGAGIAFLVFSMAWTTVMAYSLRKALREASQEAGTR